jgi:hypothetical protein
MGVKALLIAVVALSALVAIAVAGDDKRTEQIFFPDGLFYTAADIYDMQKSQKNTLYNIKMYYDVLFDPYFTGQLNEWFEPIADVAS